MKNALELLIYSLDNKLSKEEQQQLDTALNSSAELRVEQKKYLMLKNVVSNITFPKAENFTENILNKIKDKKAKNNFSNNIIQLFPKVAIAASFLLFITWSIIYFTGDNIVINDLVGVGELSPDEAYSLLSF